jgi:YD repeat-containing protein
MSRRLHFIARATVLGIAAMTIPGSALGSGVVYGYDAVGRVTSALYDNGTCLAYAYDANGNRTSQTVTSSGGAPQTPTWGTGTFGCFSWTP